MAQAFRARPNIAYTADAIPDTLQQVRGKVVLLRRYDDPTNNLGVDLFHHVNKNSGSSVLNPNHPQRYRVQDMYEPAYYDRSETNRPVARPESAIKAKVSAVGKYFSKNQPPAYHENSTLYFFNYTNAVYYVSNDVNYHIRDKANNVIISDVVNKHLLNDNMQNPQFIIADFMTAHLAHSLISRNYFPYN